MLEPGFQIKDEEGGSLQPRKVDVILYTGWKDGKYVFENATLEEIMQVLSRWYDIAVFYKREEVKKLHLQVIWNVIRQSTIFWNLWKSVEMSGLA